MGDTAATPSTAAIWSRSLSDIGVAENPPVDPALSLTVSLSA